MHGPTDRRDRPVSYFSSALARTDPSLASTTPDLFSCPSIKRAADRAEQARLHFREKRQRVDDAPITGDDDGAKEKKYDRRLRKNRQSAAASRLRREAYTRALEMEVVDLHRHTEEADRVIEQLKQQLREKEAHTMPTPEPIDDVVAPNRIAPLHNGHNAESDEPNAVVADWNGNGVNLGLGLEMFDQAPVTPPLHLSETVAAQVMQGSAFRGEEAVEDNLMTMLQQPLVNDEYDAATFSSLLHEPMPLDTVPLEMVDPSLIFDLPAQEEKR